MKKNNILFIIISAVLLCFFGFYNRFPFVFWDTGAYISMAFENRIQMDRPIFYGLFIRHISVLESLWFVILTQGLILSVILYIYFKYFISKKKDTNAYFLIYILIIVMFTGVSYYTSRLMPDAFTSIFILSFGLLVYVKKLTLYEKIYISIILVLSSIMHNTHHMLFLISLILSFILFLLFRIKKRTVILPKRLILLLLLFSISFISPYISSWSYNGKFESYKGSHVFMMNRLISTGILQDYLKENCEEENYSLCKYQDQISTSFMWDTKGPFYKDGGWEGTKEKYTELIFDILSEPKYLKKYFIKSAEASLSQFFYFDIPSDIKYTKGMSPYNVIDRYYPDYMIYFKQSLQNQNRFDIKDRTNNFQIFFIMFSMLFVILNVFSISKFNALSKDMKFLFLFFILNLIVNALLVGFFSEVRFRYQGRIVWLISLPVYIYIINNSAQIIEQMKNKIFK